MKPTTQPTQMPRNANWNYDGSWLCATFQGALRKINFLPAFITFMFFIEFV